jgi:hypothetical protein
LCTWQNEAKFVNKIKLSVPIKRMIIIALRSWKIPQGSGRSPSSAADGADGADANAGSCLGKSDEGYGDPPY